MLKELKENQAEIGAAKGAAEPKATTMNDIIRGHGDRKTSEAQALHDRLFPGKAKGDGQ